MSKMRDASRRERASDTPLGCKKSLKLSFQSPSREIAMRHSSHGGQFGERIDFVKDAEHRLRQREQSSRP